MSEPGDGAWEPPTDHDKLAGDDPPTRPATVPEEIRARASRRPEAPIVAKAATEDVVLLDTVSRNAPTSHAPERRDTSAGSVVVVATGAEAQRVRTLCQVAQLDVPIVASLGVVHDAASVVVVGEPSPPAPSRVVHIARPTLSDEMMLALLRALTTSRVVAEPHAAPSSDDARADARDDVRDDSRVAELADAISVQADPGAIERIGIEAILALTDADRAQLLFHDPASGALWSETRQRASDDPRRAIAGIAGWCAHTGHAVMASPAGDDPRFFLDVDDPEGKPQARLIVQPVIGGDRRVHAVLVAARRWRRTDFTESERARLHDFAAAIAPAIDLAGLTPPRRAARTTLSGVSTATGATAQAELSPGASIALPQQGELRPPATSSARPSGSAPVSAAGPKRAPTAEPRSRRPSAEDSRSLRESRDGLEPRDVAVIATDPVDIARVGKLAKKARLEVSVLSSTEEVPAYYRIVTIGEAWTPDSDPRVVYAARIEITDDQLLELLSGIATERAPAPLIVQKPSTIAEARRLEPAFANLRAIVDGADLAIAESTMVATIKQVLDADRAYCFYFDANDGSLWSETRKRRSHDDRRAIAGVVGWAARTGRAAHVERASADPRWLGPLDDPEGDPNSQLLVQPVISADRRVIGVLVAARRPKRPGFSPADGAMLAQLAALASPVLAQIELSDSCAQLLRDSSMPVHAPVAPSPLGRLVAAATALPRWSYALVGALVAAAIMALAG